MKQVGLWECKKCKTTGHSTNGIKKCPNCKKHKLKSIKKMPEYNI